MNGTEYKNLLKAGFALLKANCKTINDLNVFPIPDGDTGDNMCSTMFGGIAAIEGENEGVLSAVSEKASHGMLLGARGNSGVILSQIFAGINSGFVGLENATVEDFIKALKVGVLFSYNAVDKPSEGTILTVFRESVEAVENKKFNSFNELIDAFLVAAEASLEDTPNKLACLKEAGVVDSGGKGLIYIFKGFAACLNGEENEDFAVSKASSFSPDITKFTADTVMKFGYCTEFLLQLTNAKTDVAAFDIEKYKQGLQDKGDSLVAFVTGSVVKTHIHSFSPDKILAYALGYGELLTIKIENMTLQHNETLFSPSEKYECSGEKYEKNKKRKKIGIVAVTVGEGIKETFTQLGADVIITGGQGNNPSTEDFLNAYEAVNADDIFVLPDNSNIYLVAKASADVYTGSNIHVIDCKSIGEGYAAISMYDPNDSVENITTAMLDAINNTTAGSVCVATREAKIDNVQINEGDYVGFSGKHMLVDNSDKNAAALSLLEKLDIKNKYLLVAFYGNGVTAAEKENFEKALSEKYADLEFYGIDGGQDIFEYIFVL